MTTGGRGRPGLSRRRRRIRLALVLAGVGLAALAVSGYWLQASREAGLRDASNAVTLRSVAAVPEDAPHLLFLDVAEEVGIRMRHGAGERRRILPEDTGSGLAWGDVDGDGDFDLYLVNFPAPAGDPPEASWNRLYRNDGRAFTDVTAESGTADPEGFGMGASFADFDDDGDADLYVTNLGPNRLFRNRGDGSFEEVAAELGLDDRRWSVTGVWGDFDRDGRLDLYVTNYVDVENEAGGLAEADPDWQGIPLTLNPNAFDPQPNGLYRQLPGGAFDEVAVVAEASNPAGRSLGATAVDLDGDGWLDLYVANDVSPNALLLNLGAELEEALFADWSTQTGTADPRGSMGVSVTDLGSSEAGGDGLPELFITHWIAQENALYQAVATGARRLEYRDRTRALGLGEISTDRVGWGCAFVDLDLDGRRDLVVANGSTLENGLQPPGLEGQPLFLFWNTGAGFADLASVAGTVLAGSYVARGLAAADYDGDGDVDLAVSLNRGQPLLLRNDSQLDRDWVAVRLAGPPASAFGARVEVTRGGRRQVHWWGADASFASGHAPEVLFGLGPGGGEVTLTVAWSDGERSESSGVVVRRRVVVEHPRRSYPPTGERAVTASR